MRLSSTGEALPSPPILPPNFIKFPTQAAADSRPDIKYPVRIVEPTFIKGVPASVGEVLEVDGFSFWVLVMYHKGVYAGETPKGIQPDMDRLTREEIQAELPGRAKKESWVKPYAGMK